MPILKKWEIANWIWIIAAGSLLHFVYDLTGENPFVGVFVPVNESVWKHLKLLLLPVFLFSLVEYRFFSSYGARFWYAKAVGLLAGMLVIVNLFYFYTGILGRNLFVLDILTFVLGALASAVCFYKLVQRPIGKWDALWAAVIFVGLFVLFAVFTFYPPQIGLFQDPMTGGYGILKGN